MMVDNMISNVMEVSMNVEYVWGKGPDPGECYLYKHWEIVDTISHVSSNALSHSQRFVRGLTRVAEINQSRYSKSYLYTIRHILFLLAHHLKLISAAGYQPSNLSQLFGAVQRKSI